LADTTPTFPPVPKWRPSFQQPTDEIVARVRYYTDQKRDFAVFENGTCAILETGLSDAAATTSALEILSKVFNFHPDMNPLAMDDGNVLVRYNQPACNVVLEHVVQAHWAEIDSRHLDALAAEEVLITPAGPNKFDDFGKKALFGRCYMFMDAQAPKVLRIERATVAS
jgi:hypothetical protein